MHTKVKKHLSAVHLDTVLNGVECLVASGSNRGSEDKLRLQVPALGNVPGLADLGVNERVVVLSTGSVFTSNKKETTKTHLKVRTEAFGLQRSPSNELVHSGSVLREDRELVGIRGESLLQGLDTVLVYHMG
jgi:hypothetical protein